MDFDFFDSPWDGGLIMFDVPEFPLGGALSSENILILTIIQK
jgi:hypothetical protein